MKSLFIAILFLSSVFAKNVLIINSYSPTFQWTLAQSNAIVDTLKKQDDINVFVEFMDTKKFPPTKQTNQNILSFYNEKYKNLVFDAIVTTDDNAINFVRTYQNEKLFKNVKIFFSGVNNITLENQLPKDKFTGVFEVKKPIINLQIAEQLNKNLKTIYLVGDGSVTAQKNINQYQKNLKIAKKLNFIYINYSDIETVINKLQDYEKNSVMMLLVFSSFTKNEVHIDDLTALKYLSNQYKNPMITHDSVYADIGNSNIIGGNCSDAKTSGGIAAQDVIRYFHGTKLENIQFKFEQGNRTYLNEKVLNKYGLTVKDIKIDNPIIVNKHDSIYLAYKQWINSVIAMFIIMLLYIFFKIQKQKSLELLNQKTQELNEQLEEKIQEKTKSLMIENQRFQSFLDATMEAILISKDGKCIDVNKSAIDMLGYDSKEDMIGKDLLSFVFQDSRTLVKHKIVLDDAKPYEAIALKKDGTSFPAYLRGYNTDDRSMRISSLLDITHLKQLESNSKMAAMGEMIGNIAHQWRQPLSIISMGATSMLLQKKVGILSDDDFISTCESINNNAQYLSKTIDDFRNFIKGDSKKTKFKLQEEIGSFLLLVDGSIKNHHLNIIKELQNDIYIHSYPNELKQCLINLFNNSKDILIEKNIEDKLIFISSAIENNSVTIKIRDNGGGIPKSILPKIFEPYFTTKHKSKGTGLGLSMTYNLIVEGMHGTLEVHNMVYNYQNQEYTGAEFIITLPRD